MLAPDEEQPHAVHLADKFRRMLALREEKQLFLAENPGVAFSAPAHRMRALASDFPGALRELDQVPLDPLRALAEAVSQLALSGDGDEAFRRFVRQQCGYHLFLRSALCLRRVARDVCRPEELRLLRGHIVGASIPESVLQRLRGAYASARALVALPTWDAISAGDVLAVMAPPSGRLHVAALEAVALWQATPLDTIERQIFPYAHAQRRTEASTNR